MDLNQDQMLNIKITVCKIRRIRDTKGKKMIMK